MFENPGRDAIAALLRRIRRIAVVGLSPNPRRPSHVVARQMKDLGYRIVPVRPAVREIMGETAFAGLKDVPGDIDLVDVFCASDQVDPVVDVCLARGIPALWLQDGVINELAANRARAAGIMVVMDRCIWRDARSLGVGVSG